MNHEQATKASTQATLPLTVALCKAEVDTVTAQYREIDMYSSVLLTFGCHKAAPSWKDGELGFGAGPLYSCVSASGKFGSTT